MVKTSKRVEGSFLVNQKSSYSRENTVCFVSLRSVELDFSLNHLPILNGVLHTRRRGTSLILGPTETLNCSNDMRSTKVRKGLKRDLSQRIVSCKLLVHGYRHPSSKELTVRMIPTYSSSYLISIKGFPSTLRQWSSSSSLSPVYFCCNIGTI